MNDKEILISGKEAQHQCRFFLLRYVPDAIKNEFVNIGVALVPPTGKPELRFARDWSRVQALDPGADTELLDALRHELTTEADHGWLLERIEDSFSNVVQTSESKGCLTSSPVQEADALAKMYLDAPRRSTAAPRERSAREAIRQKMEREFRREGVWNGILKHIPVSQFARLGDPLHIDCGYQFKSLLKMFHATALKRDVNAAKILAFSYPEFAQGIRKAKGLQANLTAIVEDDLDRNNDEMGYAVGTLERCGIQIATLRDVPDLARTAAREMGLSFQ